MWSDENSEISDEPFIGSRWNSTINFHSIINCITADTMNEFLNDNWRDIMVEMAPAVEASFSSHFQKMAENIFNRIPIDEIALP